MEESLLNQQLTNQQIKNQQISKQPIKQQNSYMLILLGNLLCFGIQSQFLTINIKQKIKQVRCGKSHLVALSQIGSVYYSEQLYQSSINKNKQKNNKDRIYQAKIKLNRIIQKGISSIQSGLNHAVAWNSKELYSWGDSQCSALGYQRLSNRRYEPRKVPILLGLDQNIEFVACGPRNTIVKINQMLFGFGDNTYGQLGLLIKKLYYLPQALRVYTEKGDNLKTKIVKISCTQKYIILLDAQGKVYGAGDLSTLTLPNFKLNANNGFYPLKFQKLYYQIRCYGNNCSMINKDNYQIQGIGWNNHKKIMLIGNQHKFKSIRINSEFGIGCNIENQLYCWGSILNSQQKYFRKVQFFKQLIQNEQICYDCGANFICAFGKIKNKYLKKQQILQDNEIKKQQRIKYLESQILQYKKQIKLANLKFKEYQSIIDQLQLQKLNNSNQQLKYTISKQQKLIQQLQNENKLLNNMLNENIQQPLQNTEKYFRELKIVLNDF